MDEFNAENDGIDVPFNHLALVAQTVGENIDAAAAMLERGSYEGAARDRERLARDLSYARNWARDWAPDSMRVGLLDSAESREVAAGLDEEQREYLADISAKLGPEMEGDEVQDLLYSTAVGRGLKPKRAFAAVYRVLLGKTSGPKAGPFVASLPLEEVRRRFSA
jgi:lysyl-tRNA synthetase class 1